MGAVTAPKLRNSNVTTEKIRGIAVTGDKIFPASVDTGKLADAAVTNPKLASSSVRAEKLGPIVIRSDSVEVPANELGTITESCGDGERLLAGGGGFDVEAEEKPPQLLASLNVGADTWRVRGYNPVGAEERTLTVRVICLDN